MFLPHIVKILIGVLAIGPQYLVSSIIMNLENSTSSQMIKNSYVLTTHSALLKKDGFDNATRISPSAGSIRNGAKFFNKASPKKKHKEAVDVSSIIMGDDSIEWRCPNITGSRSLECACDLPHTLRCNGDVHGLTVSIFIYLYLYIYIFVHSHIFIPLLETG